MIEIQCTSCHTRYRIDERVLPDDTPTFKCSRCGHVFNADPVPAKVRKPALAPAESESETAAYDPPCSAAPQRAQVAGRKRRSQTYRCSNRRATDRRAEAGSSRRRERSRIQQAPGSASGARSTSGSSGGGARISPKIENENQFGQETGSRRSAQSHLWRPRSESRHRRKSEVRFQRRARSKWRRAAESDELERPEPHDGGWQVGETPEDFEHAQTRQAPSRMADEEPAPPPKPTQVRRMAAPLEAEMPRYAQPPAQAKSSAFQMGRADDDDTAESTYAGATHSSGVFLALFFFVAIAFLGASALICGEPAASARILSTAPQIGGYFARPIVPAMLVALHDVHSEYYALKGGHTALVITGTAQNVGHAAAAPGWDRRRLDRRQPASGRQPERLLRQRALGQDARGDDAARNRIFSGLESAEDVRDGSGGVRAVPDGVHRSSHGGRQD